MKTLYCLFIFFTIVELTYSQKLLTGYIVSSNGDTIKGQVEFEKYLKEYSKTIIVAFYDSSGKKYSTTTKDIFGYGFYRDKNQQHFTKLKTHDFISVQKFVEQYIFGKISVYIDEVPNFNPTLYNKYDFFSSRSSTNFKFYVRKDTDEIFFLNTKNKKQVKKVLGELMADCPKYSGELNRKLFAEEIYSLIISYNNSFCFNTKKE
jgi:hypothetical protein